MQIDPLASSGFEQAPQGTSASSAPRDQFLRLLVAQLQHQDPLSPQDSASFVAQLAQFASLEQSAETNHLLQSIESSYASTTRAGYTNLVGRVISARTDHVKMPTSAANGDLSVHLETAAENVEVAFLDASGREVKTVALGARGEGDVDVVWDGTDQNGVRVADGTYTIEVRATGPGGATVDAYAQIRGLVDAVEFRGGSVIFRIGANTISPAEIVSVADQPQRAEEKE